MTTKTVFTKFSTPVATSPETEDRKVNGVAHVRGMLVGQFEQVDENGVIGPKRTTISYTTYDANGDKAVDAAGEVIKESVVYRTIKVSGSDDGKTEILMQVPETASLVKAIEAAKEPGRVVWVYAEGGLRYTKTRSDKGTYFVTASMHPAVFTLLPKDLLAVETEYPNMGSGNTAAWQKKERIATVKVSKDGARRFAVVQLTMDMEVRRTLNKTTGEFVVWPDGSYPMYGLPIPNSGPVVDDNDKQISLAWPKSLTTRPEDTTQVVAQGILTLANGSKKLFVTDFAVL